MPLETLGEFVARCRKEQGLSLRALGRKAGIAFSAIYKVEHGISRPSPETLERLSQALRVSYELLDRLSRGLPDKDDRLPEGVLTPEEGRIRLLAIVERLDIQPNEREYLKKTTNAFFDLLGD
jgi:transcriptional regulator with XRE-family HTH domain